jgi:molybdopterin biosynthesis enzyme
MRPGKPLLFGRVNSTPVLALPGNPTSVVACSHLFLGLLLDRLAGIVNDRRLVPVPLGTSIVGTPGRTTLAPGVLCNGQFLPISGRHHGLGAVAGADGYAVVGEEGADAGTEVLFAASC